jgi:hypothetical protein
MPSFAENCLVDSLAAEVNLHCLNPLSNNTFQPADIVTLMGCNLSLGVVPLIKKTQQNYFVMNVDVPIVAGKSSYTMPTRAIGNALRDVVLLDASGNEVALNNLEREYIKVQFPFNFVPSIWSFGQYVTANEINLYNTLVQSYTAYTLRFITERRPGELTLSSNCGQISAITGNVLTLSYVDPAWTTATTFDIINPLPPFQSIADDATVTLINGYQITLTTVPTGLAKGQWICPAMMSCIPQIPYEFFPLLIEMTVADVARALDMSQLLAATNASIAEFKANALALARPRVTGSPKIIINKDSFNRNAFGGAGGGWR